MPDWGSMAGEITAPLPSWDQVSDAASGAWGTVKDTASGIADGVGSLFGGMGDIGPMVGEMVAPLPTGLLPSDFLPSMPDIGPMVGEMMLPTGLLDPGSWASDFVGPSGGGGGFPSIAELMPSLPSLPWDQAGELMF